jgi:16S rRNA C1402 N4-methylase RsmH
MTTIDDVSRMARAMIDAQKNVEETETAFKEAKARLRYISEESIPAMLIELGIKSIKLEDGSGLSIKHEVYAQIPLENRQNAFEWLNDNGFGGLIKTEVSIKYGKGERELARCLSNDLKDKGLNSSFKEDVHAMTLKAFLKEQMAKGTDIPLCLFGARPVWTTKITKTSV